jgi:AcrR family transcriptional regulator
MPIEVDEAERLSEIADATLAVAQERGTRAVTLRAVGDRLGRSTAFITNFVPSRTHLMVNALEHAQSHWGSERAESLGDAAGLARLVAITRWMCTTTSIDGVLRSLWIEVIADVRSDTRRAYDVVRQVTDATYGEFQASALASELAEPELVADILYLYCRGFHVKTVEDPERWTDDRVNRSLEALLRSLFGARVDELTPSQPRGATAVSG